MKKAAAIVLVVVGLLQIAGDVAGIDAVKAVGAATGASPAPKVFSAHKRLETYSTRFFIETGARLTELTPELYARVRGPYNRRNVYGAALAYAPVLPPELRDPVLRYALCGEAALLRELGIEAREGEERAIVLVPREGSSLGGLETRIRAPCR